MRTLEARLTSPLGFAAAVAAAFALWIAMAAIFSPVFASHDAKSVHLHAPHQGASSRDFQSGGEGDCAGTADGQVVWHFVANKLTPNSTLDAFNSFEAQFVNSGFMGASSAWAAGPRVWHFYVTTNGHDTVMNATATFNEDQPQGRAGAMLVLSHVCVGAGAGDADGGDPPDGGTG